MWVITNTRERHGQPGEGENFVTLKARLAAGQGQARERAVLLWDTAPQPWGPGWDEDTYQVRPSAHGRRPPHSSAPPSVQVYEMAGMDQCHCALAFLSQLPTERRL